jgi:hypothetical protein
METFSIFDDKNLPSIPLVLASIKNPENNKKSLTVVP